MLTRSKESDTYLVTVGRHRWSLQIAMKVDKMCSFQPALRPSSAEEESLPLQLMKGAVLAESYTFYPLKLYEASKMLNFCRIKLNYELLKFILKIKYSFL